MKCLVITKKQLMTALCLVCAVSIAVIGSVSVFANSDRLLPIYCVETDKKQIAISFDAAWGNDDTEELIKILKEYDVPATFFVVGAWVDKYPESVEALHKAGHQIQNHSNTHPHMPQLSREQMKDEIVSCNEKIKEITGKTPTLLRPPYGDYDNALIETMNELKMATIQWDVDSLDWKNLSATEIALRIINGVKPGSIILCHNNGLHTAEALPMIFSTLKNRGFTFVPIGELIYKDNYTIDHNGRQIPLAS